MKKVIVIAVLLLVILIGYVYKNIELEKDGDDVIAYYFNDELHIVNSQLNDGPYVRFENDTTIDVSYLCQGELSSQLFFATDTFKFDGFCHDSTQSYVIPVNKPTNEPYIFDSVSAIFALSDIHGRYEYAVELLQNNGIIDNQNNWSFGDGFLVLDGDLFDRGRGVTELLWLMYRLQQQARQSGGELVYLLGNHDVMCIIGDLRYLHWKYTELTEEKLNCTYDELFDDETVIGRWLRSKNVAARVNDLLFVHAGMNPTIIDNGYDLGFMNRTIRENLNTPYDSIKQDELLTYMFRGMGPIWYRGFWYDMEKYPRATDVQIDSLLAYFDVNHIVVGHSVMDSITPTYSGKVIGINQDYEIRSEYEGLLWEDGNFYACDIEGNKRVLEIKSDN